MLQHAREAWARQPSACDAGVAATAATASEAPQSSVREPPSRPSRLAPLQAACALTRGRLALLETLLLRTRGRRERDRCAGSQAAVALRHRLPNGGHLSQAQPRWCELSSCGRDSSHGVGVVAARLLGGASTHGCGGNTIVPLGAQLPPSVSRQARLATGTIASSTSPI